MEGLEKVSPFVSFCQLCGFFPYRMEVDPITKRFKRFTFSICHPVTFWYLFVNLTLIISCLMVSLSKKFREEGQLQVLQISPIQMLVLVTEIIDLVIIYVLVYRLSIINEALEIIQQLNETIGSIPNKSFSIMPRICIGAVYALISVGILFKI